MHCFLMKHELEQEGKVDEFFSESWQFVFGLLELWCACCHDPSSIKDQLLPVFMLRQNKFQGVSVGWSKRVSVWDFLAKGDKSGQMLDMFWSCVCSSVKLFIKVDKPDKCSNFI
ncbi:hypothetical protein AB3S75_034634 [Citrus x aurantiifolia]